jgi:hypothetical protein
MKKCIRSIIIAILILTVIMISCRTMANKESPHIGTAEMLANGVIVLTLRAESETGVIGDAQFIYKPGDKQYQEILGHVGGLKLGESKYVPPWRE